VMVNNSTNINKTNKLLLASNHWTKKHVVGNPGPIMGHAQKCGGIKPVYEIPTLPILIIWRGEKVCQWLATGRWSSLGSPVSSTNKSNCHDIIEILLTVAINR
jgi:hypothetical protein